MQENSKYAEAFELIRSGYHDQKRGKIRMAVRKYKASIRLLPTAEGHTYLGWAYSLVGKYDRAILECYKAIDIDEDYGNSYNDLGYYLTLFKRYDEAKTWLTKAIAAPRFDERYWAYYNLGRIHELTGNWNEALKLYYRAIEFDPKFSNGVDATLRLHGLMN
ncbi:MAG: tetratricopeptide repeat protein [Ignavibacteriales bacterium]|nr:tetratricopeptide repeat protein [Ignavibacteriales bacterium]